LKRAGHEKMGGEKKKETPGEGDLKERGEDDVIPQKKRYLAILL